MSRQTIIVHSEKSRAEDNLFLRAFSRFDFSMLQENKLQLNKKKRKKLIFFHPLRQDFRWKLFFTLRYLFASKFKNRLFEEYDRYIWRIEIRNSRSIFRKIITMNSARSSDRFQQPIIDRIIVASKSKNNVFRNIYF